MPWLWAHSRLRAIAGAGLVLTAALLFTKPASSTEATFALTWRSETKTQCVTESALRASVARKLGRSPFADHDSAEIVLEGVERALDDDRWRARIVQRGREGVLLGERQITAKSCEKLLRAATFVVALFIDPNRDQDPAAEDEAPAPAPPAPPRAVSPPPSPVRSPRPRSRERSAFELRLGVGASAASGLLPSVNGSMLAMARIERRSSPWSFDWTGAYSWPQAIAHGTIRGEFAAVAQRARACLAFIDRRKTRVEACGGALWAAVIPQATGVVAASEAWRKLAGPTSAVALELRAGAAAARLEAGLEIPFGRYAFSYLTNTGEPKTFYTTGGIVIFVAVGGLQAIFP